MLWDLTYLILPLSLISWLFFINQLYFVVGTRGQGPVSPDTMFAMTMILSVIIAYYSEMHIINQLLLFAGLCLLNLGTSSEYYKFYVILGLMVCWTAIYYRQAYGMGNSFGISSTPAAFTPEMPLGPNVYPTTHINHRHFLERPTSSNYAVSASNGPRRF